MVGERGNDLSRTQLYVFNADAYPAIARHRRTSSQGIDGKLEGFLAQGLRRRSGMVRWRDDLAHVCHDHIAPQVGGEADSRLQLLHEAPTQGGVVCPKTDAAVPGVNSQTHAVLFDTGAQAVDFVSTQALGPEMVAAELDPLKSMTNGEIEHFTGIGLGSKANRRDSEVRHQLTPFSGLL